jgi:hypothetical protein
MSDVPEGESILMGTFSLHDHPIVILFNTGATHDFISKACTQRYWLTIEPTNTPYVISTPRGRVITKELVMHSSQPHRKIVQNQSHCPGWPRHQCDTGHELDEGAQGTT